MSGIYPYVSSFSAFARAEAEASDLANAENEKLNTLEAISQVEAFKESTRKKEDLQDIARVEDFIIKTEKADKQARERYFEELMLTGEALEDIARAEAFEESTRKAEALEDIARVQDFITKSEKAGDRASGQSHDRAFFEAASYDDFAALFGELGNVYGQR